MEAGTRELFKVVLSLLGFVSVGGESTVDNCQILQTRVNRFKSNKQELDKTQLKGYSCEINFTGMAFSIFFFILCDSVHWFFFVCLLPSYFVCYGIHHGISKSLVETNEGRSVATQLSFNFVSKLKGFWWSFIICDLSW